MYIEKYNFKFGDNIYKSIDLLTNSSNEIITTSTNLITLLSNLFDSIEDDITHEIQTEAGKINDFISSVLSFSKNELQEIKIKSKILMEKADKRKNKIFKLKEENKILKEKIKEDEFEKEQLIINIDNMSKELSDLYQEKKNIEKKSNMEQINKRNEKIIKERYIQEINNMQRDMDILREKNKTFENNVNRFRRMSIILEEKNKKLNDELGTQTMQFINKMKEQNNQKNIINSLKLQNDDLYKKTNFYQSQIEKWKIKCKMLEDKLDNIISKNAHSNYSGVNYTKKKIDKKVYQHEKKQSFSESDDSHGNLRYKTFSNLNDLLGNVSDHSNRKNSDKVNISEEDSFDFDYFFEINFNIYDNFFF